MGTHAPVFCCVVVAVLAVAGPIQGQSPATVLEPGKPVQREIRGGEKHSYGIRAEAGQFVSVIAFAAGINVSVTMFNSSGKPLVTAAMGSGSCGPEVLSVVAEDSGDLRLDITAFSPDAPAGRYLAQLTPPRVATPTDQNRIKAARAYTEGCSLYALANVQSADAALTKWQESASLWQSLGDQYGQAIALNRLASACEERGDRQKALEYYNQVLLLLRATGDRADEATTLNAIGLIYYDSGDKRKALDYYDQALPLQRALGDRASEATTLTNIGLAYDDLGEKQKALDYYNQALPLRRATGNRGGEATTLSDIGAVWAALGDKQKALDYYNQALPLARAVGNHAGEAATLANIGGIYNSLGEKRKALDYDNQALPLLRAAGNRSGEAAVLNNIGGTYDDLGEKEKALDYYNQALPLRHAVGDRGGEATTLANIGKVCDDLGQKQKALDYFNQALPLLRAVGDRAGEAKALNNIGLVYQALGEKQKALDFIGQALPLLRAVGDRAGEAAALNNIGGIYNTLGDKQNALQYFNEALPLLRAVGDRSGEAAALSNIGTAWDDLGEKQRALDYYNQALPLRRAVEDRAGEATTLNNIGFLYYVLGENQKALEYYSQALPLKRAVGDRAGEATVLNSIGAVCDALGDEQKALDYYNQALPLRRSVGDRAGEAKTLNNIGAAYGALGEKTKELDYYNQALPLAHAVGDRAGEAKTLTNIGEAWDEFGDKRKALDYYNRALPLSRAVQDPLGEASTLALLMEYWNSLHNTGLAALFGKEAIDRFQQVRRNIAGLDNEVQRSFLKSKEDYYRELAGILVSTGRLPEARQVLDLLKAEEYSEFTQRRGGAGTSTSPVALTPAEDKSNREYERITAEITAVGEEWRQLDAKASRSADEERRYNALSERLTAANRDLQAFLKTLYDSFGRGDQANARVETIDEQTSGLQTLAGELGGGVVSIYTLVLDQKCVLMVITPATRVAREIPVGRIALRGKVFAFLGALARHDSEQNIQPKARDLYDVLIAPIEKDLQGAQAKTLVWSLDDVLRYVPLAALYDGRQYLVERYQNVAITTASIGNLKDPPQVNGWRGVAMGVSRDYDGLGELKAVPGELAAVVRSDTSPGSHGPVPGTILLDDRFTEMALEGELHRHPPLVHIASHYVFHVGDDSKSYLLLGGKDAGGAGFHLTLANVRDDQRIDFKGVELLTLSGCQTALGSNDSDGREIDGLGITAQRKGARAVMATLWEVDDASVGLLMAAFYKLWVTTPGMTKAEALRLAQLALLHDTSDRAATSRYANPYYWAPFTIIGNWK